MATGLEEAGFGLLGVPRPPDTTELERQVGVLESLGRSQESVAVDGVRAYRLGGANTGAATDALAEHVGGQVGVLRRSTVQAQHASLGAGAARVAWSTVKWAGGILVGLAGMAGLAALTPQGRALIRRLLRPVAQRMQQWLLTATRFIGRIYTRLAGRLRGTPAKRATQAQARARYSIQEARSRIGNAETGLAQAQRRLGDAKMTLEVRLRGAYARGEISEVQRAQLARQPLADHPYLDEHFNRLLRQRTEELRRIDSQLGPVAGHLDDAGRRVNDGLDIAKVNGPDASELQKLRDEVSDLRRRLSRLRIPE
ncbi:hypothetical protein E1292_48210 [Nonomuraea deserti]|uniref:Uncharacterized protein n=1 Tax=Nonomuraea deserti TaxID=1848322 RepID=A0A4R4UBP5_9ACTN|nr:hypothetical protein [Nonomuraea deserti]TDC86284.1 hypothetical protein E1292_48210 [Nonomuraea deserti]